MPLDLQVVRAPAQFDQGASDDVDKAPGKLTKRRGVAFTAQLTSDPRSDFRDAAEAADGVVARGDLRPAQVKDIKLVLSASPLCFHIHAGEELGIALGVEDDHHFLSGPVDILSNVHLGHTCFTHPGGAQYQRVAHAFDQW
ncbi:hypothetical protein D3C80_198110 [compost metagenome]